MGLLAVLAEVVAVMAVLLSGAALAVVGVDDLRTAAADLSGRVRSAWRPLGLLAAVLVVNSVVRDVSVALSWLVGLTITDAIFAVEGALVAQIQALFAPTFALWFGYVYVYGYVFLLVFPLVLGVVSPDRTLLRHTAVAYTLNYALGIVCYLLFVAYGPRNYMPEQVTPLLFDTLPRFQLLTSQVNVNTNVFPSLHTSLSVTVALLSLYSSDRYPRWVPVAWFLAANVVLSTMVLGIHWATDVVAGTLLGALSVRVATGSRFG